MSFEPTVSIVMVNLNGLRHLDEFFRSIQKLDYPKDKLEVIMVDNGSTDESVAFVRRKYSWAKIIRNVKNEGFAKPSDDGTRAAAGEYVAFLNNDMKVQRDWLRELLATVERTGAACAGSVILNWNGELLDFAGGSVTFFGMGFQYHFHEPVRQLTDELAEDKELLFACGGAMLMKRALFLEVGGFDEDFFAYFEDLDLGWRLNVLGYKVVLSVKSRAYHKHHSTGNTFAPERMRYLYFRNSLYMIYKNFGDEMLAKSFWPAVLMNNALIFKEAGLEAETYDLRVAQGKFTQESAQISHIAAAHLCAQSDFVRDLSRMTEKRCKVQSARQTSDAEILRFFSDPFACVGADEFAYSDMKYNLITSLGMDKAFGRQIRRKVLLVTRDHTGQKMAGPAIRYYEFARALGRTNDVVLGSYGDDCLPGQGFETFSYSQQSADKLYLEGMHADIIITQGFVFESNPVFAQVARKKYLVFDLYDPIIVENIEALKDHNIMERRQNAEYSLTAQLRQLRLGDFFIAANEKQRDYWMGMLSSVNRVTPEAYNASQSYNNMIDLVPFGIADEPPVHTHQVLKGVWPGIQQDDFVLIWGGGVWNWFDPLSLIRAVHQVSQKQPRIKLFFMGVKSPNPDVPEMKMLSQAVELAKELGVYDKQVFFNFGWVDYDDRQNYLLEADAGVSFHFDTMETRLSFRTRILDYLWAGLPIISTQGDYFADLIESKQIGITTGYQNVQDIARAIEKMMEDKAFYAVCKANLPAVAEQYRWSRVCRPLVDFCSAPVHTRELTFRIEGDLQLPGGKASAAEPAGGLVEYRETTGTAPRRRAGKGGVLEQLDRMEERQAKIEKALETVHKNSHAINGRLSELQTWSYMMNDRFNRIKGAFNPLRVFKRLFRRR